MQAEGEGRSNTMDMSGWGATHTTQASAGSCRPCVPFCSVHTRHGRISSDRGGAATRVEALRHGAHSTPAAGRPAAEPCPALAPPPGRNREPLQAGREGKEASSAVKWVCRLRGGDGAPRLSKRAPTACMLPPDDNQTALCAPRPHLSGSSWAHQAPACGGSPGSTGPKGPRPAHMAREGN